MESVWKGLWWVEVVDLKLWEYVSPAVHSKPG